MSNIGDKFNKLKQTIVGTKTGEIDTKLDSTIKDITVYRSKSGSNGYIDLVRNIISKQGLDQLSTNKGLFSNEQASPASFGQGQRILRYKIYESIVGNISYCKRALDVLSGNILSPDDITKMSLEIKSKSYLEDEIRYKSRVNKVSNVVNRLKIDDNLHNIVSNTLLYGDYFCEIADAKTALTSKSMLSEHEFFSSLTANVKSKRETVFTNDKLKVTMNYSSFLEGENTKKDDIKKNKEDDDKEKINLNNINLVFHHPNRVVKLQSELFPLCFGYLVFPKQSFMNFHANPQEQAVNDICMNILKSLEKQIPQAGELDNDDELKFIISSMIKESGGSQVMNIRYIPPNKMTHFMVPSTKYYPYGESIFDVCQFDAKVLMSLTTALAIQRLARSTEKRKIGVEIGLPKDAAAQVQQLKEEFRKRKISLDDMGTIDTIPSMISTFEDIYIPQKDGKPYMDVETFDQGNVDTGRKREELEYLRSSIVAALGIPNAFLNIEEELSNKCLDLFTKIPLVDGTKPKLIDLIEEYENYGELKDKYVYSYDNESGKIVPGKISWAGKTRLNTKVVRVTFDNGETQIATPDHKFMLRDGSYKEAQYLKTNESLMPFYSKLSHTKTSKRIPYLIIYHPGLDSWELVHRSFAKHLGLINDGDKLNVHHEDFNPMNNNPTNLKGLNDSEHVKIHIDHKHFITTGRGKVKLENYVIENCCICEEEYVRHIGNNQITCLKEECKKERARLDGLRSWEKRKHNYSPTVTLNCPYCGKEFTRSQKYIDNLSSGIATCGEKECKRQSTKDNVNMPYMREVVREAGRKGGNKSKEKLVAYTKEHGSSMKGKTKQTHPELFSKRLNTLRNNNPENSIIKNNHKVSKIEFLNERYDTGDITVDVYHNFAIDGGVIVSNSVLSEENVLFARTIITHQKYLKPQLNDLIDKILMLNNPDEAIMISESVDVSFPSPRSLQYERESRYLGEVVTLIENLERIGISKEYTKKKYLSQFDWHDVENWETNENIEKNLGSDEEADEEEMGGF